MSKNLLSRSMSLLVLAPAVAVPGMIAQGPQAGAPAGPPINQSDDPLLKPFVWRSIGPAVMSGRVDDIEIVESNPSVIYVGYATGGLWKSINNGITWVPLFDIYPVSSVGDIGLSQSHPDILYIGTGEPNNRQSSLFGAGVYKSSDGGKRFEYVGLKETQSIGRIVIHPKDPNIVYIAAVGHLFGPNPERGLYKTTDGGKTFRTMGGHGDHHALVIDRRNSNHLLIGNDGGIDFSYDQGETWEDITTMAVGQFYAVSADMRRPYYVCGGLQDNGSWCGPSAVRGGQILNTDWYRIGGGDGFYTQNDPTDWAIGYSESQDGATSRYDLRTGRSQSIRPRPPQPAQPQAASGQRGAGAPATGATPAAQPATQQAGGRGGSASGNIIPPPPEGTQYRFYWNTPFILSPHDPRILYLGGDRLFRSADRGNTYTDSPDLPRNIGRNERPIMGIAGSAPMASKHDGAASYSKIVTISESAAAPGIVWVGTNDGNVQVSRDGGVTWNNVIAAVRGVPAETHVSRVEASHFDAGTCYVTFDGHRSDDHKPYVFVTRDYGASWTSISSNLPEGNVNVIREDPKDRSLLYLGTEYAFYISLNGGREWKRFMNGLPTVRIDDILVHPRDNDLIVGTHGRSIYIIDDITPLQQLTETVLAADAYAFDVRPNVLWINDTMMSRGVGGAKHFRGQNPPDGTAISYYLKSALRAT